MTRKDFWTDQSKEKGNNKKEEKLNTENTIGYARLR